MHEMINWDQQSNGQPDQPTQDVASHEGPHLPPDRNCYICGHKDWRWNAEKERYECSSGDPAHPEHEQWLRETFPEG